MMKRKRKTIGESPLDVVIPREEKKTPKSPEAPVTKEKARVTVYVPEDLAERVRNAVYWTPGLTLSDLAERAFRENLMKLEKERGEPFPPRRGELTRGRGIS